MPPHPPPLETSYKFALQVTVQSSCQRGPTVAGFGHRLLRPRASDRPTVSSDLSRDVPRSERILLNFIEFREIGVEIPFEASQRNRLLARGRVRRWRKTFSKNIRKPSKKRCLPVRRGL